MCAYFYRGRKATMPFWPNRKAANSRAGRGLNGGMCVTEAWSVFKPNFVGAWDAFSDTSAFIYDGKDRVCSTRSHFSRFRFIV